MAIDAICNNGNTPFEKCQNGCAAIVTIVIVAMAILLALKVAVFITGIICTVACGLALLCCASSAIQSCAFNR